MGERYTDHVIRTNLTGLIYGSQVASAGMIRQGHGAIYGMEELATELKGTGVIILADINNLLMLQYK